MSVLIKGMEMPKNCLLCPFCIPEADENNGEMCVISGQFPIMDKKERSCECPLIEIPPHGRLIDADALLQEAHGRLLLCAKYGNEFQKPYEILRAIELAPTVIPADVPDNNVGNIPAEEGTE